MKELDTKKTYDRFAQAYQQKRQDPLKSLWNEYLDVRPMRTLLKPLVKGKKVLDLGCGFGSLSQWLHEQKALVQGQDLSQKMIELAQESYPHLKFQQGPSHKIKLAQKSVEVVASALMVHYLKDPKPTFKEVARVLKPQGHFIFSFHHPVGEILKKTPKGAVLSDYFEERWYDWEMLPGMKLKSYHHTFESMVEALRQSGFVVKRLREARPPKSVAHKYPDFYRFASLNPTFCLIHATLAKAH